MMEIEIRKEEPEGHVGQREMPVKYGMQEIGVYRVS